jgi:hypothetical protein
VAIPVSQGLAEPCWKYQGLLGFGLQVVPGVCGTRERDRVVALWGQGGGDCVMYWVCCQYDWFRTGVRISRG